MGHRVEYANPQHARDGDAQLGVGYRHRAHVHGVGLTAGTA